MLISEMEAVLKSLDQRVGRIEQILPTLATRAELRDEIRGVRVLIEDVRGDVRLVHERIDAEASGLTRRTEDMFNALQQQTAETQKQVAGMQEQITEVLRRLPRR